MGLTSVLGPLITFNYIYQIRVSHKHIVKGDIRIIDIHLFHFVTFSKL